MRIKKTALAINIIIFGVPCAYLTFIYKPGPDKLTHWMITDLLAFCFVMSVLFFCTEKTHRR